MALTTEGGRSVWSVEQKQADDTKEADVWRLKKDGEWFGPKWRRHTDAWIHLLRSQPQSVSYGTEYGGWEIKRCSPLIRTGLRR
jgi:hypothetical protein